MLEGGWELQVTSSSRWGKKMFETQSEPLDLAIENIPPVPTTPKSLFGFQVDKPASTKFFGGWEFLNREQCIFCSRSIIWKS